MKHVLGTNEHFTISKGGTEQNVDDLLAQIPALQEDTVETKSATELLTDTLISTLSGLSAQENKWDNGQSWGGDCTWK